MPPLSPGCLWVCSTLPFDESSPPVCSMLPRIVPPFCTSSVPVISLLVQTTSGVSRVTRVDAFTMTTGTVAVTESEAVTLAVLIPLAVSALVSGSYSITAPSGKRICRASADADGAGLSRSKINFPDASVAQLDRVLGYEPSGRRFESSRMHHILRNLQQ